MKKLKDFTGTEQYHRHFTGLRYTDGIKYLADEAEAHWLIDVVASYQCKKRISRLPFQVWRIAVGTDKSAVITMREDIGQPAKVRQYVQWTDFPLDKVELWLIGGVLLLPSEY